VVAVDDQTSLGTFVDPHGQGHRLAMAARRTGLARIGRIHSHHLPSSFLRFGLQLGEEHRPRDIRNGFGEFWVLEEIPHHQRFHRQQSEALDQLANLVFK
jgi:hypothetical protein